MKASKAAQEKLLALQALDSSLIQLDHKAKTLPVSKLLDEKTIAHATARDLCVAAETEKSDIKHELSKSEVDVEQVVSRIERDEKRLSSGQGTPKELEQLQHELGSLAARRSELEEIELEIMMRIDVIKERITEQSDQESALTAEITELEIKKANQLAVISADLEAITVERASVIASTNPELVALYEKIRASNNGTGAAALVGNQCKGCHLTVNNVELQRIAGLAEDEVVRCEECRCILVRDL